ncbi:hypothetical protein [Actinomadura rudentiformis]|nr:hypothetical protein [Actinomadura rudentiformis]
MEWIEPDELPNGGRRVGPAAVAVADVYTVRDGQVIRMRAYAHLDEAFAS